MKTPLAIACLTLLLAACATSTPPVRYHTLLLPPASAAAAPTVTARPWQLLPVTVPAQVDRPQWVVRTADDSLAVLEQEHWIAPLADEIGAALSDTLGRRLGPPSLATDVWRVRVDVQRFESVPARLARLDAVWALQAPGGVPAATPCAVRLEQPVGGGYVALAQAHRELVARLGERIAAALAASAAGRTPACEPAG